MRWPIGRVGIVDDRGRACALVGLPERKEWPRGRWFGLASGKPLSAAMAAEAECARRTGMTGGLLIGLSGVAFMNLSRWMLRGGGNWPSWIAAYGAPVLMAFLFLPAWPVIGTFWRWRMAAELRAAYLKSERCAACGFSLAGLSVEEDDCRICPECGGAWKPTTTTQTG